MDKENIAQNLHRVFIENRWTLSAAESCTGGRLSARLTTLPGASKYFLGSVVVYSNMLKVNLLKISPQILSSFGAVSKQTVEAMIQGILDLTRSDYAVAVSGIAGPEGGSSEKPIGTLWGGLGSRKGKMHVWQFHLQGTREQIMESTVDVLLQALLDFVPIE